MSDNVQPMQSRDPVTVVYGGSVLYTQVETPGPSKFTWRLNEGAIIDAQMADEGKTWVRGHASPIGDDAKALLKQAMAPVVPTT